MESSSNLDPTNVGRTGRQHPVYQVDVTVFRHIAPHRGCTSGEGARQAGGRWNPSDSFPVIYTGLTEAAVVEEFFRLAERSSLPPESFLPRALCEGGAAPHSAAIGFDE
jgi:hypothetical protein